MTPLISFAAPFEKLLAQIVKEERLHVQWLNTLSYLENCGARKIAACEHPTLVKEEMLKHAAEEFRHAHHLKRQMAKLLPHTCESYSLKYLLGGTASLHYLRALDARTSRYLAKEKLLPKSTIRETAYLLVTYAIELRAEELYCIYDEALRRVGSKVTVKSILMEEKEHLNEMTAALKLLPSGVEDAEKVCSFEGELCKKWICELQVWDAKQF